MISFIYLTNQNDVKNHYELYDMKHNSQKTLIIIKMMSTIHPVNQR